MRLKNAMVLGTSRPGCISLVDHGEIRDTPLVTLSGFNGSTARIILGGGGAWDKKESTVVFSAGTDEWKLFLYPERARREGTQGMVWAGFLEEETT